MQSPRPGFLFGALLAATLLVAARADGVRAGEMRTGETQAGGARCSAAAAAFANPPALERMARGFNMPGWDRGGRLDEHRAEPLRALRRAGMTHVRLPVDDERILDAAGPAAGATAYLADLGDWIDDLQGLGYAVSVDLHPGVRLAGLYESDPDAALRSVEAIWMRLADVVRAFDPASTYAELLNEPPTMAEVWRAQLPVLAARVRELLPRHTIVAAPFGPQRHESLAGMPALDDPNIVYAVHFYDPFAFTHQGADWTGEGSVLPKLVGLPFPSPPGDGRMRAILDDFERRGETRARQVVEDSLLDGWSAGSIGRAFDVMARWTAATGKPVVVNEFGVYAGSAPRASRLAWLGIVAREAGRRCIGWAHWDYEDGFGLVDAATQRLDAGVVDALGSGSSEGLP